MRLRQLVDRWVERFNRADVDSLMELYHPDAIIHPVTQVPAIGLDEIRTVYERAFAKAEMHCIPEAVHETKDVVVLEWRDPMGSRGCGIFTIRDGLIMFQRGYWDRLSFLKTHGIWDEERGAKH
jgi:ketosteroid isomerase-like protein